MLVRSDTEGENKAQDKLELGSESATLGTSIVTGVLMRWSTLQEVQSKMEDFSGNFLSYTSVSLGSGNQNTGSRACAQAPSKECFPCLFKK